MLIDEFALAFGFEVSLAANMLPTFKLVDSDIIAGSSSLPRLP